MRHAKKCIFRQVKLTLHSMPIYPLQRFFYPQNRPCTPKIVGTFYMQRYKVKGKKSNCTPLYPQFQNSVGTLYYWYTMTSFLPCAYIFLYIKFPSHTVSEICKTIFEKGESTCFIIISQTISLDPLNTHLVNILPLKYLLIWHFTT